MADCRDEDIIVLIDDNLPASKLKADFVEKKAEIKEMEETDPKDMYVSDLNELKKKFK